MSESAGSISDGETDPAEGSSSVGDDDGEWTTTDDGTAAKPESSHCRLFTHLIVGDGDFSFTRAFIEKKKKKYPNFHKCVVATEFRLLKEISVREAMAQMKSAVEVFLKNVNEAVEVLGQATAESVPAEVRIESRLPEVRAMQLLVSTTSVTQSKNAVKQARHYGYHYDENLRDLEQYSPVTIGASKNGRDGLDGGFVEDLKKKVKDRKGVVVVTGIDAKKLGVYFDGTRFERIHFNFPMVDSSGTPGRNNFQSLLIQEFFGQAKKIQELGDRVYLTAPKGFKGWTPNASPQTWEGKISAFANEANYTLIKKRHFYSRAKSKVWLKDIFQKMRNGNGLVSEEVYEQACQYLDGKTEAKNSFLEIEEECQTAIYYLVWIYSVRTTMESRLLLGFEKYEKKDFEKYFLNEADPEVENEEQILVALKRVVNLLGADEKGIVNSTKKCFKNDVIQRKDLVKLAHALGAKESKDDEGFDKSFKKQFNNVYECLCMILYERYPGYCHLFNDREKGEKLETRICVYCGVEYVFEKMGKIDESTKKKEKEVWIDDDYDYDSSEDDYIGSDPAPSQAQASTPASAPEIE